jgi:hypothetical protein
MEAIIFTSACGCISAPAFSQELKAEITIGEIQKGSFHKVFD